MYFLYKKTRIFSTDFRKNSNMKFHENLPVGAELLPDGRTDRHDEIGSRFLQFYKCA